MVFKVASFNVENMFTRPNAMADSAGSEGQNAIDHHALWATFKFDHF
jgi:hypothetical protein